MSLNIKLFFPKRKPIVPIASKKLDGFVKNGRYWIHESNFENIVRKKLLLTIDDTSYTMETTDEEMVGIPRAFGIHQYSNFQDHRCEGEPITIKSQASVLRPWQTTSLPHVLQCLHMEPFHAGIINAGCGLGKTCFAIEITKHIARKTIVLVHRRDIAEQWKNSFTTFAPELNVCVIIGQKNLKVQPIFDVAIVMIQTMVASKQNYLFPEVGFVIVDECHHICAKTFQHAMYRLNAKYILGLSATLIRSDKNERAIEWLIGPVIVSVTRQPIVNNMTPVVFIVHLPKFSDTYEFPNVQDPKTQYRLQQKKLVVSREKNLAIAQLVIHQANQGRTILVMANQTKTLNLIGEFILKLRDDIPLCFYIGVKTNEKLKQRTEDLKMAKIILATKSMCVDAFNHPIMDTLVFFEPIASGGLEQAIGRIIRTCDEKICPPQIFDLIDAFDSLHSRVFYRKKYYQTNNFQTKTLNFDEMQF